MIDPISLAITAAMKWGPSLVGELMGDEAEAVADNVVGMAKTVTGLDDPADALGALEKDPAMALQFQQSLMSYSLSIEQEKTKRLQAVNETMQAESKSEHWMQWSWRPFNGYMFGFTLFFNYAVMPLAGGTSAAIPEWVFMAWASVLGVTAWHRGVRQRVDSGEAIQTPLSKLKNLAARTLQ